MKKYAKEKVKKSNTTAERTTKQPTGDKTAPAAEPTPMERARHRIESSRRAALNRAVFQASD